MSFNVLTIQEIGDAPVDTAMYPRVSASGRVYPEDGDGHDILSFIAKGIAVHDASTAPATTVLKLSDVRLDVTVSNSRLAFVCRKYDKGGGWIGTSALVPVFNAVSKLLATARNRGNVLAGHVRMGWIANVGFGPKSGWLDDEKVRIILVDGTTKSPRRIFLDLVLPKEISSAAIANTIIRRAATYCLAYDDLKPDDERAIRALTTAGYLPPPDSRQYAFYSMPTSWHASPSSAYLDVSPQTEATR